MDIDRAGCEILDEPSCVRLLSSRSLGRLALTQSALPVILPVAFFMVGERPLMPLGVGAVKRAAEQEAVACFQVDDADSAWRWAWSVAMIGRLSVVDEPTALSAIPEGVVPSWELGASGPSTWAQLLPHLLSGRRYTQVGTFGRGDSSSGV